MTFPSILFEGAKRRPRSEALAPPVFFADLNLDQIVAAVIAGKEEYNLTPFFYAALHDVEAVLYRHEVMRDLEDAGLKGHINAFAQTLRSMRAPSSRPRRATMAADRRRRCFSMRSTPIAAPSQS